MAGATYCRNYKWMLNLVRKCEMLLEIHGYRSEIDINKGLRVLRRDISTGFI
jgi:hypothetical protein